ncbi:MAG: hypothetical protein ACLP0J_27610 [Solirubrobacteraceae bacterium]
MTSKGTTPVPLPSGGDRWQHAVSVQPLATVPVPLAERVEGLTGPRGYARQIVDPKLIDDLYAAVDPHALPANTPFGPGTYPPGPLRARPGRHPRPFDPDQTPSPATSAPEPADAELRAARIEQGKQDHHQILVRLHAWLTQHEWSEITEIPGAIDLSARRQDGLRVIFEAKTITPSSELHQTRGALAQLLEYRVQHGHPTDHLCLICDQPITTARAVLLDQLTIAVGCQPDAAPEALSAQARRLFAAV